MLSQDIPVFVDVQGFKVYDRFIVKEVAVLRNDFTQIFYVKSPILFTNLTYKDRKQVEWLYNKYHGLSWRGGRISFHNLKQYFHTHICKSVILSKGSEKCDWIAKELLSSDNENVVINVESLQCPAFERLYEIYDSISSCTLHRIVEHREPVCSMKNVMTLSKYFHDNCPNFFTGKIQA